MGRNTKLFDQVNNLFHNHILFKIHQRRPRRNEAGNLGMDDRLATRIDEVVHRRLNLIGCHIAGRREQGAEDDGEVYDIAHHTADVLVAEQSNEVE
jgi:hypothetical protein